MYCRDALEGCGAVYNGSMYGTVTSPGYPSGYANNLYCDYHVSVPRGRILLAFHSFSIEHAPNCERDVLVVSDLIDTAAHYEIF